MAYGPLLFGHTPPFLRDLDALAARGVVYGSTAPDELALAERIRAHLPSMERLRFATTGSEAVQGAVRVARAFTGCDRVLKFAGNYHGHFDLALQDAGASAETSDARRSGIPRAVVDDLVVARYNDLDDIDRLLAHCGDRLAAILVEPICGNMGLVETVPGFLEGLRERATRHGALLIFDEIPSGLGRTGTMFACEQSGCVPDMLVLGKGLGGGIVPMAALLARADLDVAADRALGHYTHEKSPVGCAAALATLDVIEEDGLLPRSRELGARALARLTAITHPAIRGVRGMGLSLAMDVADETTADRLLYACLERGLSFKVGGGTVLTLCPPLTIAEGELDDAIDILAAAFRVLG